MKKTGEALVENDGTRTKIPVVIEGDHGAQHIDWVNVPRGTKIRRGQELDVDGKSGSHKRTRWV